MSAPVHQVRLSGGDIAFDCAPGDTLLRAAQRAGLGFPYECNVGSCGNCKFELIEGEVATAWPQAPGLSDKDRQRKRQLGCQCAPLGDCTIKLRTMDRYAPVHCPQRLGAVLRQVRALTHDISEFSFAMDAPFAFEPGQYALAWLPGIEGPRAYSMSNVADPSASTGVCDFQVRRVGAGSAALFALLPGARVEIDGPYGMAWLRRDAPRDILCLAGGSGLAPMISIARGAMVEPRLAGRQLHFVYGGRTAADICGQDLLQALPGYGTRLHYSAFISSAPDGDSAYPRGFVHEAALQLHGEKLKDMEIYFAGPPLMATAVQSMLLASGVPPEQQHFDQFY
jgi:toluene monooxygenase electron transfer component